MFPSALAAWDLTQDEYRKYLEWKQPKDEAAKEAIREAEFSFRMERFGNWQASTPTWTDIFTLTHREMANSTPQSNGKKPAWTVQIFRRHSGVILKSGLSSISSTVHIGLSQKGSRLKWLLRQLQWSRRNSFP